MADENKIVVARREGVGKGSARAARRQGLVPGVIYGDKKPPESVQMEQRVLEKFLNRGGFFNTAWDMEMDGKVQRVLPRDVQFHVVTDKPLHVDFLRLSRGSRVTIELPVRFLNEATCPGLKRGGVLNVVRHEIEVRAPADAMPDHIDCDLAGLDIGDSLHISAVPLPEGVEPTITDRDFTIATIAAPTVAVEPVEEEEGVGAPEPSPAVEKPEEGE